MATRAIERGSTAERVSRNVRELRTQRRLSLDALARRLAELGRPIGPAGINKVEMGTRRVDVDDLVAFALALDTNPNRLLLDPAADQELTPLIHAIAVTRRRAWAWAAGDEPLPADDGDSETPDDNEFQRACRPHNPPSTLTIDQLARHDDVLAPVVETVAAALDKGLALSDILDYAQVIGRARQIAGHRVPALRPFANTSNPADAAPCEEPADTTPAEVPNEAEQ